MRILHTADWHLGRIFYRVHLTDDQAHILDQLIAIVAETRPDVVVVAGDIYDRAVPPPDAVSLLDETISRLVVDHGVPLVMISGNHDSPDRLGFGARMLARQHMHLHTVLTPEPHIIELADAHGPVTFVPVPFTDPAVARQVFQDTEIRDHDATMQAIVGRLPPRKANERRVMVSHIHAEGGLTSDSERPLVVGGREIVRLPSMGAFDYVALGHLHRPQNLGGPRIRYSGSLLKYSFAEAEDEKSVSLIELGPNGEVDIETIPLTDRRDVCRVEGHLADLLAQDPPWRDAYLEVTLLDEGPVIDAIGQLRSRFPHVLHIIRPHFNPHDELAAPSDHRRVNAVDMFSDFYTQVVGQALTEPERAVLTEIISETDRTDREVFLEEPADDSPEAT